MIIPLKEKLLDNLKTRIPSIFKSIVATEYPALQGMTHYDGDQDLPSLLADMDTAQLLVLMQGNDHTLRAWVSAHMDQHLSDMLADDMLETLYHHFTACLAEYPTVFSEDIRRTANDLGERKHIDDLVRLFNESPEHLQKLVRVSTSGSPHNEHHVDQSIDQEDS